MHDIYYISYRQFIDRSKELPMCCGVRRYDIDLIRVFKIMFFSAGLNML